jgi:hypothetical protein
MEGRVYRNWQAFTVSKYSVSKSGRFDWFELVSGQVTGSWKIDGNTVTLTLPNGSIFKADVGSDNTLVNIQSLPGGAYTLGSLVLNNVVYPTLDNTVWTGTNFTLRFKPGNLLDLEIGASKFNNLPYVMMANTVSFYVNINYKWFVVASGPAVLTGASKYYPDPTIYPILANKF